MFFCSERCLSSIKNNGNFFTEMNKTYDERRKILYEGLKKINGVKIHPPNGAFYGFPELPNKNISSIDFCKKALDDYGLVLVPGLAFGNDQCVRISSALKRKNTGWIKEIRGSYF